jgi:hypothetical protein
VEEEVRRRHNESLRDTRPTPSDVRVLAFPILFSPTAEILLLVELGP